MFPAKLSRIKESADPADGALKRDKGMLKSPYVWEEKKRRSDGEVMRWGTRGRDQGGEHDRPSSRRHGPAPPASGENGPAKCKPGDQTHGQHGHGQ